MLSKQEFILQINEMKARMLNYVMGEFNTMILIARPYMDFMNVISILPPKVEDAKYIQPNGEYSPPIFTQEEALRLLETTLSGWRDDLVIISLSNNIASNVFIGDNISEYFKEFSETPIQQSIVRSRRGGPRPGYKQLPTTTHTPSQTHRVSVADKEVRNADIREFYEAGVSIREIAELVGLSVPYTYQLAHSS